MARALAPASCQRDLCIGSISWLAKLIRPKALIEDHYDAKEIPAAINIVGASHFPKHIGELVASMKLQGIRFICQPTFQRGLDLVRTDVTALACSDMACSEFSWIDRLGCRETVKRRLKICSRNDTRWQSASHLARIST